MANHMKEIAKMLGVEMGKRFNVFDSNGKLHSHNHYYFSEKDILIDGTEYCECDDLLRLLIIGVYTVKPIPYKPKFDERYYSIGPGGVLEPGTWMNDFVDRMLYRLGNCYRTITEAESNCDKWIAFYESDKQIEV